MNNNKAYVKIAQMGEIELYKFIENQASSDEEIVNAYILAFQCQVARLISAYGKKGVEEIIKEAFEYIEIAKNEGMIKPQPLELVKSTSTH